jgi:hypothetical protein
MLRVDRPIGKGTIGGVAFADGFGEIHSYLGIQESGDRSQNAASNSIECMTLR